MTRLDLNDAEKGEAFALGCEIYQFMKHKTKVESKFEIATKFGKFDFIINRVKPQHSKYQE